MTEAMAPRTAPDTPLRSLLFVPGDDEKKLAKASKSDADALIIDLEDSVSASHKEAARDITATHLQRNVGPEGPALWVRVNPLSTSLALNDLAAVVRFAPAGIMLPKIDGPEDLTTLTHHLDALEAAYGLARGSVKIIPVVTETPTAVLRLGELRHAELDRVYGFTWGAEDLSASLGAATNRRSDGRWADTYRLARSATLLAAAAAGVHAIETLYVNMADLEGLAIDSRDARAEGFTARIAIHPAQVGPINDAFTPSESELEQARRVVEAFGTGDTGVVALDGRMLDAPHLRQARHILSAARSAGNGRTSGRR
ncbi:HpcH/HpaI aldolase/citrate lyase family protein [Amycolatopsis thermoflava]|uniref:HpcH/HpaI aldolase/citrate lyase family protein n=1 Tax=Amycolatopsis thermoflava TaxID=84480 RepID=UPI00040F3E7B|nr:CoA ester lyase [Amycolatopsis thermoflava]